MMLDVLEATIPEMTTEYTINLYWRLDIFVAQPTGMHYLKF